MSVTANTIAELQQRVQRILSIKQDLKHGDIAPREADRVLRPAFGRRLTVNELWGRYFPGVPIRSKAIALSTFERRIKPYFGDLPIWSLDEARMRNWVVELLEHKFATKTIRSAYDYLAGSFNLAIDAGDVDSYPWRAWRPPKVSKKKVRVTCTTVADFVRVLQAAKDLDRDDWQEGRYADRLNRVVVTGLTGLRNGEAAGLGWDHVDLRNGVVHIDYQAARGWKKRWPDGRPKDPPKTAPRTVRLHPAAIDALKVQRRVLTERNWYRDDGPVFPGRRGRYRSGPVCIKPELVRELAEAAGFPNVAQWTTHSLRHAFATMEANASRDLIGTMRRTGHQSLQQLQNYMHQVGVGLPESAIPALPPGLMPEPPPTGELDLRSDDARTVERAPALDGPELGAVIDTVGTELDDIETELDRRAAEKRARDKRPFEVLAAEWLANERKPQPRPPAVTRANRTAYVRAYKATLRAGGSNHDACAAGRRARKASLGAWAQSVKRAELPSPKRCEA